MNRGSGCGHGIWLLGYVLLGYLGSSCSLSVVELLSCLCRARGEKRGPLRFGGRSQVTDPDASEVGLREKPRNLLVRKPEPDVAHPLTILLAIVRRHVDDEQPAAWLQHAS